MTQNDKRVYAESISEILLSYDTKNDGSAEPAEHTHMT